MKVGDYVRTKDGKIFKWTKYCTTSKEDYNEHTRKLLFDENEIKSSPNIIDLIEAGDYVNGERVINIIKKYKYLEVSDEEIIIDEEDIKSIVTKEMFESIEYKVGDKE